MRGQYIYDDNYKLKKAKTSAWTRVRRVLVFFVASLSMAVLYYVIFALVFSTDEEKRLRTENKAYESELPELEEKERLLSDVVEGLRIKDDRIYEEIFHASAPNVDPISAIDILSGLDTIPDRELVRATEARLEKLEARAGSIEENFMEIARYLKNDTIVIPPMALPLEKFSFAQTGASTGDKVNPFYKVKIRHNGLDMISASGEPVHAAADGVVAEITRSRKGLGNVVTIDHGNGIIMKYCGLDNVQVSEGKKVKMGDPIAVVGSIPCECADKSHLHLEATKKGESISPMDVIGQLPE